MDSGVPWHLRGVRREVIESAQEAARRAGMPVEAWLDRVIAESARDTGFDPAPRLADFDPPGANWPPAAARRDGGSFAEVSARLDDLTRQLDALSRGRGYRDESRTIPAGRFTVPEPDGARQPAPHERRGASAGDRADSALPARDNVQAPSTAPAPNAPGPSAPGPSAPGPSAPATNWNESSVDQALAEIAARQRALEDHLAPLQTAPVGIPVAPPVVAPPLVPPAAAPALELPRAPTQRLPDLEAQLRQINARIEGLQPCRLDGAVETLRDDLAEIGVMLKEALPRQAIESLESEIRSLAARIDGERHAGADADAIAGIERGLAEVRDALQALTPAENLVEFERTIQGLSDKIDRLATTAHDPEAFKQLEGAIVALRGVVSHVASNDALTQLSDEVRTLAAKVDQATATDAFSAMEQRIAAIADALAQSRGAAVADTGFETAMRGLVDKVDQLHASRSDQTALKALEDRIVRLVEKLDASGARLDQLGTIERALADLLIQIEGLKLQAAREPAPASTAETETIKRDVRRTQDTLESVHGTLGHVVDRLATIEAGLRQPPRTALEVAPALAASAEPVRAPTTTIPAPAAAPAAVAGDRSEGPPGHPVTQSERRPIDPSLPPDHPLEPGQSRASPAERIAASEAALENVRPPVIADPAGKSDFIAAARRAAQAAAVEAPAPVKTKRPSALSDTDPDKSGGGPIRKVLVGASVVMIVLGTLHFVTTRLWPSGGPTGDLTTQAAPPPPVAEPPEVIPAPPPDRHSTVTPPVETPSLPDSRPITAPPALAAAEPESTGSVRAPAPGTTSNLAKGSAPSPNNGRNNDRLPGGLRVAAEAGDAAAEFELASRLADGRGVPQNVAEAAQWFERAAGKGLAPAQFRLGGLYEKGNGVRKNPETARRLYTAAAEAGHAKAMHNLAVLYAEGIDGKPNYALAARWFRKAADHGVIDSQYNLAILYARGIGVETNLAEAFKWFALASREGDRDAAKKRDDVAGRLDKATLSAAMAAAQSWQAQPQPEAAVQVKVPPGGWDSAAAPATPKRSVGPKIETPTRRQAP